ncbi:hypothetical protein NHX12_004843 [Muraenolepis orangiensis]|nr:hypothetical protein NHX12_004843 [Muraenolepis orangiensis]
MDRLTLARIDDELGSSEVAALCFLCRDVLNKKALETASIVRFLCPLLSKLMCERRVYFASVVPLHNWVNFYLGSFTCSTQVKDGIDLFEQLDEKALLSNRQFLSQLLETIKRVDLLSLLEGDEPQTDSSPILSDYR